MPHSIIEYSKTVNTSVDINKLVQTVFSATVKSNLFKENSIKTRAISYDYYMVGNEQKPFIHVTVKLLSGRTMEQKEKLSEIVFNHLKELNLEDISLSVEIVDMEKETYSK